MGPRITKEEAGVISFPGHLFMLLAMRESYSQRSTTSLHIAIAGIFLPPLCLPIPVIRELCASYSWAMSLHICDHCFYNWGEALVTAVGHPPLLSHIYRTSRKLSSNGTQALPTISWQLNWWKLHSWTKLCGVGTFHLLGLLWESYLHSFRTEKNREKLVMPWSSQGSNK